MTTAKPVKAGDVIVWTHYSAPGEGWQPPFERIGTVWDGAPTGEGLSNAWWVHPDEPDPRDPETGGVIAVGRASRRDYRREAEPQKGDVYGSWDWRHQAGALTNGAARYHAARYALAA